MAICKAKRFGLNKFNPWDVDAGNNEAQIRAEIKDVRRVCDELEEFLGGPL